MKHRPCPTSLTSIVFLLIMATLQGAMAAPPEEPNNTYLVSEEINIITGLYTREYSLSRDGIVDYKTARQIVLSEYNEYWNSVVETIEFPLFYWHDSNHDGHFDMWIDQVGEGCLCDLIPYELTSKK